MFIFVELSRFVGEQIGFEVLAFGPAGPDVEPGRYIFLSILVFRIFSSFLNYLDYLVILGYHSTCNF